MDLAPWVGAAGFALGTVAVGLLLAGVARGRGAVSDAEGRTTV